MKKIPKKKYNKILCFDLDNVICKTTNNNYSKSKPIEKNIHIINQLYNKNFYIKIFTARYMGRNNEKKNKVLKKFKETKFFLTKVCKLKFHKLIMCKPTYDLFIDDKSLGYNKNWSSILKKKYL